jgi:hypothetical protein
MNRPRARPKAGPLSPSEGVRDGVWGQFVLCFVIPTQASSSWKLSLNAGALAPLIALAITGAVWYCLTYECHARDPV